MADESKIVKKVSQPKTKVQVSSIREIIVAGQPSYRFELHQFFNRDVETPGQLVGFFMAGNSAFGGGADPQKVTWINLSPEQFVKLLTAKGFPVSPDMVSAAPDKAIIWSNPERRMDVWPEFKLYKDVVNDNGEIISQEQPLKIVDRDSFTPDTWIDRNTGLTRTQDPKRAGTNGPILTHEGRAIYNRKILATIKDVDEIIPHTNNVVAERNAATNALLANAGQSAEGSMSAIGSPEMVFEDNQPDQNFQS